MHEGTIVRKIDVRREKEEMQDLEEQRKLEMNYQRALQMLSLMDDKNQGVLNRLKTMESFNKAPMTEQCYFDLTSLWENSKKNAL